MTRWEDDGWDRFNSQFEETYEERQERQAARRKRRRDADAGHEGGLSPLGNALVEAAFPDLMAEALAADAEKLSAMTGEEHTVYISETCPHCGGSRELVRNDGGPARWPDGSEGGVIEETCPECGGAGFVMIDVRTGEAV